MIREIKWLSQILKNIKYLNLKMNKILKLYFKKKKWLEEEMDKIF